MKYNFLELTNEKVKQLNRERAEWLEKATNGMMVEPEEFDFPFMNDLRFNHGYICLYPFMIHGQMGLKLELKEYPEEKKLHIAYIGVPKEIREQGYGSEMLNTLNKIADKYGYTLDLVINAKFGVKKSILNKFYNKHGFKKEEIIKDYRVRVPKKKKG